MKTFEEKIEFTADSLPIKGVLHLPAPGSVHGTPPVVIGSHGLEGTKNSAKQIILSKLFPENGIGFLRFDHRGCGKSKGDFLKDTTVPNRAEDIICAVQYLIESRHAPRKIGLFGSSLGGSACIEAWNSIMDMNVKLSGIVITAALVKSRSIENIPALPMNFVISNLDFNLFKKLPYLTNILIFHGKADEIVPVENAHTIYANAQEPKKLILFKNGDHQTSAQKDQKIFEKETIEWFCKVFNYD